jgi:hypothetical protein
MTVFPVIRIALYCTLVRTFSIRALSKGQVADGRIQIDRNYIQWVLSLVLLGLSAARIHYTENLSPDDPLNGGQDFYDPVVAELLATSIIVTLWSMFA